MNMTHETQAFARALRARGRSTATIVTYEKAFRTFGTWLTDHGHSLADVRVTKALIEEFLGDEFERGLARQTVHQHFTSLRTFFKFVAEETDEASPMTGLTAPNVPLNPPPVLTETDKNKLLATATGKTFGDRRDLAILSLFMDTGMRRGEIAGITTDAFDLDELTVTVTGKGGRTRTVPYGPKTARALDRYARLRDHHPATAEPWFWLGKKGRLSAFGIEDMISRRGAQAGVAVHPHLFRHTWAHDQLAAGVPESEVITLAGWRSGPIMLQRYGAAEANNRAIRHYREMRSPVDRLAN
jgi:site-specific recombinase XerD